VIGAIGSARPAQAQSSVRRRAGDSRSIQAPSSGAKSRMFGRTIAARPSARPSCSARHPPARSRQRCAASTQSSVVGTSSTGSSSSPSK
jgi:hypothetical protein